MSLNEQLAQALGYTGQDTPIFGPDLAIDLFNKHGVEIRVFEQANHKRKFHATIRYKGKECTGEGETVEEAIFTSFIIGHSEEQKCV